MNNNKIIAIVAVVIIVVAGLGVVAYMLTKNDDATITIKGSAQFTLERPGMTTPVTYANNDNITVKKGDVLTVTATSSDNTFLFWDDMSTAATRTYTVTGNATLTAYMLSNDNTVIDARGRNVTIPDNISSVFAIGPCSLEIVSFFDSVNKVQYLDGFSNGGENPKDMDRITSVMIGDLMKSLNSSHRISSAEGVVQANPDIIVSDVVDRSQLDNYQSSVNIPVFAINADMEFNSAMFYYQLIALGKLFGEQSRAQELVDGILSKIDYITDNSSPVNGMSAYVCGMNFYTAGSFTRTSGNYLPFEYSKLNNISPPSTAGVGAQPYEIDIQHVINENPNIIFVDGQGLSSTLQYINDHTNTLKLIDAISDKKVYKTMVYKDWGTNWPNVLINIYYIASIVHPDLFSTESFESYANEILQLFYPDSTISYETLAGYQSGGGCGPVDTNLY